MGHNGPGRHRAAGSGVALAVRQWGEPDAQPVLLLHGYFGDGRSWDGPTAALRQRGIGRHWLAVDLPGHGRSCDDWPETNEPAWPWLWRQLDGIAAGLDRPPLVIGYSMGARIAASWALAHELDGVRPNIAGLVLESGHPGLGPQAARERVAADDALADRLAKLQPADAVHLWESQPVLAGQAARMEYGQHAGIEDQRAIRLGQDPSALALALRLWGTGTMPDLRNRPPRPELPAMILTGEMDAKFSALAAEWSKVLPNAQLVSVPGAGHPVSLERTSAWAAAVAEWAI